MTSSSQSEETTIRIVFDGAPLAGKTTAAYSLAQALGGTTSTPLEEDGRTIWFDWMTYTGGRHNGKAIRVELVTVPGQDDLIDRRRHLLKWGDVIVFVADTGAAAFESTVAKYEQLQSDHQAIGTMASTIVIANKRDLDDALDMELVRSRLGLTASDEVVEAVAADGSGLRQAFVFAVRAALATSPDRADSTTAEALLADMQSALEPDVDGSVGRLSLVENTKSMEPTDQVEASQPNPTDSTNQVADVVEPNTNQTDPTNETTEVTQVATRQPDPTNETTHVADPDTVGDDHVASPRPAIDAPRAVATATRYEPGTKLVNTVLHDTGIEGGAPIVLLSSHWDLIVKLASGGTTLPLSSRTRESQAAVDLLDWGLVSGDIDPKPQGVERAHPAALEPPAGKLTIVESQGGSAPATSTTSKANRTTSTAEAPASDVSHAAPETQAETNPEQRRSLRHARYRALRALRQSLRGY